MLDGNRSDLLCLRLKSTGRAFRSFNCTVRSADTFFESKFLKYPSSGSYYQLESFLCSAVNCSPNDKILDWSKAKAFADEKIELIAKMMIFVFDSCENIIESRKNTGYQKVFYSRLLSLEVGIM